MRGDVEFIYPWLWLWEDGRSLENMARKGICSLLRGRCGSARYPSSQIAKCPPAGLQIPFPRYIPHITISCPHNPLILPHMLHFLAEPPVLNGALFFEYFAPSISTSIPKNEVIFQWGVLLFSLFYIYIIFFYRRIER